MSIEDNFEHHISADLYTKWTAAGTGAPSITTAAFQNWE
jgi:hypothetical protein